MSYLSIDQLNKQFGNFTALCDISLKIEEGEFVCFLGPSGCGKTTLLRAIAGLEPQDQGQITQQGENISNLPPQQRDFGIVFQSYALFPNLTVADNIAYGLKNQHLNRRCCQQQVAELLKQVDLPGIEDKFPGQLSGGQQQRVALARALATEPGLLLLDEPLSALDARVRLHLRQEIRDLQRKLGVTTIMVTHDQDEALTMADRIVVMDHGCIAQVGTPREIYDQPATDFVARFIGTMNFLDAQVSEKGSIHVDASEVSLPMVNNSQPQGLLAFRPESVQVSTIAHADNVSMLQLTGKLQHSSFLGAFERLSILTNNDQEILVDLAVQESSAQQLSIGQQLWLKIPAESLHFYPKGDATEARTNTTPNTVKTGSQSVPANAAMLGASS